MDIVIIGAGDLGTRLAALRVAVGDAVTALRRRPLPMPAGVQAVYGDLKIEDDLRRLPPRPDWLVFCATPDARNETAYRQLYVEGLARALRVLQPRHTLFVSSTAVYAQDAGEWVDEDSAASAQSFNGRVLREAEALCLQRPENRVLRLSGITGPGRRMLVNRALLGEGVSGDWTNRIHIDDAAAAAAHLIDAPGDSPVWIASDDEPAVQVEVANWIRARHGLPPLPVPPGPARGRRVSSAKLRAAGWQPRYPSYRETYAEV